MSGRSKNEKIFRQPLPRPTNRGVFNPERGGKIVNFYRVTSWLTIACAAVLGACSPDSSAPAQEVQRITCSDTAACAARGGVCTAGVCRADNECASDADCASGNCEPDPDFGGLCSNAPYGPAAPEPAWSCTRGADCPAGQGCGSDGLCHADGSCTLTWDCSGPDGCFQVSNDCAAGEICATGSPDRTVGFCTSGRGGPDPYCRSDGAGACRRQCFTDDTCPNGVANLPATCTGGFCVSDAECTSNADCTPGRICTPWGPDSGWDDYGFNLCLRDPNPTCVVDNAGVCRLPCTTSQDCIHGGGCAADNLCHASNECTTDTDCASTPQTPRCYPNANFGGLCGPIR